jgi:lauroyl/myristoyl acyltransferase
MNQPNACYLNSRHPLESAASEMWLLRTLRFAAILTPLLPARIGYALCWTAGVTFYLLNFRARRNVLENLSHVAPRHTFVRRQILAARVCVTVVTNYYDLLRLRSVDRDEILELVEVDGLTHLDEALAHGKGVIIYSAHLGNFSVMARLPAALGYRATLVAEEVTPRELFNYMARLRSAMGIEVIPPGTTAIARILRLLRSNGILLVAGDRDITGTGLPVLLFGERTTLPFGPAHIAMRTGAELIPAYTVRITGNRSRVVLQKPVRMEVTGDWDRDLQRNVQRLADALEMMIQTDAGQWAVLQRVWPPTSRYGRSEGIGSVDKYLAGGEIEQEDTSKRRAG